MCVRRISLGGEGNALYPVLSCLLMFFLGSIRFLLLPCSVRMYLRLGGKSYCNYVENLKNRHGEIY